MKKVTIKRVGLYEGEELKLFPNETIVSVQSPPDTPREFMLVFIMREVRA